MSRPVSNTDYPSLEKISELAIKEKQKFERLVVTKEKLLEMFNVGSTCFRTSIVDLITWQYNKYKQYLIQSKIPDGTSTTVYRCGPMIDLCVGPHIPHTGKIKAFMITKVMAQLRYSSSTTTDHPKRIPHLTSSATQITSLCNVSMVYHSRIKSNWQTTRCSLRKLRGVIIGRSERWENSCIFSNCMSWPTRTPGARAVLLQRHEPRKLLLASARNTYLQYSP